MPQITIDEMKNHAAELVRSVQEQRVEYVIVKDGAPVALLTPTTASTRDKEAEATAAVLTLLEVWRADEPDDEMPYDDFLAFLEQNRLDLSVEP